MRAEGGRVHMWAVGKQWGGMRSGCVPCKAANEQSRNKGGGMRAMQQGARRGQGACAPSSSWGTRDERHGERRGFESWGADHVVPGMSRSDRKVEVRVYSRVTVGMSMHPTGTTSIHVASVRAGAGEAAPDAVHVQPGSS